MRLFFNKYKKEIGILILAFIVEVIFFSILIPISLNRGLDYTALSGDSKAYILLAENILSTKSFSLSKSEPYFPESFRSPGYPAFLAALFSITLGNKALALFLQGLILSFLPLVLYLLFRHVASEKVAWFAAIISIFEPIRLFLSNSFLSDGLFALILALSLLLFFEYFKSDNLKYLLTSGALLGFSILIRPIAMFLPFLFFAYFLWDKKFSWRGILIFSYFLLAILIIVFPWMLRNKVEFDSWQISSVGSFNFAYYNSMEFLKYHGESADPKLIKAADDFKNQIKDHTSLALSNTAEFNQFTFDVIGSNPFGYLKFHLVKTIPFFVTDGLRDIARSLRLVSDKPLNISSAIVGRDWKSLLDYLSDFDLEAVLFFVGTAFWSAVSLLAGLFFIRQIINWRIPNFKLIFLFSLVIYFALLTGPVANGRYRFPVAAFLILFSINLLSDIINKEEYKP